MSADALLAPPEVRLATPEDEPFLRELYREIRAGEFAALQWSHAQVATLCDMQFNAQAAGYRSSYPAAEYLVICNAGAPAGRMIKAVTDAGLALVDIALMPAFRERGWGTFLLRSLQEEARGRAIPLILQVEKTNRALSLYRRLGFVIDGEAGLRHTMRWTPAATD